MKAKILAIFALSLSLASIATAQQAPSEADPKACYQVAKQGLEAMLSGKEALSYEKAIFLIENAWWDNAVTYSGFQSFIDLGIANINSIAGEIPDPTPKKSPDNFFDALRQKSKEDQGFLPAAKINFAIYKYMTDTIYHVRSGKSRNNNPYRYAVDDPLGSSDWSNTQVTNLLLNGKGNCFAFASLFRIYAERLGSGANICTAPSHIYIRHKDGNGTNFNVEIASRAFPGTGTLSTLTYTTQDAIRNGISLRELDLQQSVALCLVYLAKGYEHKFNPAMDDGFMMDCAASALHYDSLSLNAMLLKAELLEKRVIASGKAIGQLQAQADFKSYEMLLDRLYRLGYREMPLAMKNTLIKGWTRDSVATLAQKNYLSAPGKNSNQTRYASLSWGLFDEDIADKPVERYGQTLYNTKQHKITGFAKEQALYNNYSFDPVLFALSIDPLAAKYPSISPYAAFANNPIMYVDLDGREPTKAQAGTVMGFIRFFNNTSTRMGTLTGRDASNAMIRLGQTAMNWSHMRPEPTTTPPFNTAKDKYLYTEKGGWIDMAHFLFYAGKAYSYKIEKQTATEIMHSEGFSHMREGTQMGIIKTATQDPVGEAVQDGYKQEMSDKFAATHSAYSYEDLPSDKFGADFGANYFDPQSKLSFGEQLYNYLNDKLGVTDPQAAPNYSSLPATDPKDKPTRTNHTTSPVYTKQHP